MSSLHHMVGPRRRYENLVDQQNDAELLIQILTLQRRSRIAMKILGGVLLTVAALWFVSFCFDQEDQRMDAQTKTWRAQGYPIPNGQ